MRQWEERRFFGMRRVGVRREAPLFYVPSLFLHLHKRKKDTLKGAFRVSKIL